MTIELQATIVRPGPDPLPFDAGSFGYLYNERDRQGRQQLATFNRMMTDLSAELLRVKTYLDTSYAPLITGAAQTTLETLGLLGVPADTSSSSAADIEGYISTVNQALAEASDQLASLSTEALAFSGSNVLELAASQIKAANMSRIPKHWLAWGPFPESEQGIYQKAYGAALQSRVVSETIKTLQERLAALNTSLEQAKVREAQAVLQSISSELSAITAPAHQQLAAHRQALENQFSDSSTRTNAEREAATQAVQQAVEQAYQQLDTLIASAGSRVNAGELAQINQSIRAMASAIAEMFTDATNQQMANANALIESQRHTVNQAGTGAATQVSARVAELIAQVQATPTRDIAASAQQSLKQATDTAYAAASNQIHIASHADTVKRQEVSAGIQSARDSAQAQLQALPGTTQAAITQAANSYRFAASAAAALTVPGQGTVPLAETVLATLRQGIANAIAALGRIATAGPGAPIAAALTAVFYSRSTASEEQDQTPARFRYGLGVNAHDLGFSANADLNAIAAAQGTVELPYRLTNETRGDGRSYISVVTADGVNISKSVPVRAATFDPQTGRYAVTVPSLVPDRPPITLTWTPAAPPGDQSSSTTTPVVPPPVPTYTGVELQPLSIEAETYPGVVPDARDLIITFPADSGLEQIYLMLSDYDYQQAPKELIAFPDAKRVKSKSSVRGGGSLRKRWKDSNGRIFEWDNLHGTVELYDKQGKHLGEFDPVSGNQTQPAIPGRTTSK